MDAKRVEPLGNTNLVTARKRDAFALRPVTERRIVDLDFPAHWQGKRLKPTASPVNCAICITESEDPRRCAVVFLQCNLIDRRSLHVVICEKRTRIGFSAFST